MNDGMGGGDGAPAKTGLNECMRTYNPHVGGYQADSIEAAGAPGAGSDVGAMTSVARGSGEGAYDESILHFRKNDPHSTGSLDLGGPPLGSTEGPPDHNMY